MKLLLIVFLMSFSFLGCQRLVDSMNEKSFSMAGGPIFSSPERASAKEIHLRAQDFINDNIIVEGQVVEIGDHETFLTIEDESGKLLVNIAKIKPSARKKLSKTQPPQKLKIFGQVDSGKRGMPIILAKSLYFETAAH